jgi:hypothetical protein
MALFAIRLQKPIRLNQHQPEGHCWSFPGMGELMCYSALGYIIGRTDTILCASFEKGTAEATAAGQVGCRHVREKMLNIGSGCCAYSQEKYECRGNYTCIGRLKYLHTTTTANRSRKRERDAIHSSSSAQLMPPMRWEFSLFSICRPTRLLMQPFPTQIPVHTNTRVILMSIQAQSPQKGGWARVKMDEIVRMILSY